MYRSREIPVVYIIKFCVIGTERVSDVQMGNLEDQLE